MYSKQSVGQRVEPWGIAALTRSSCEDFPSRTTWSSLLPRKEEDQISNLKFHKAQVDEEDQHAKLCQKPLIYQVLHLK